MSGEQTNEIERRFNYRPPTPDKVQLHEALRAQARTLAHDWSSKLPEGREKALALTALQEALMWANTAVATEAEK